MVRLLKSALDGAEEDLTTMLSEEILNVDDQLLEIEKGTREVSGTLKSFSVMHVHFGPSHHKCHQCNIINMLSPIFCIIFFQSLHQKCKLCTFTEYELAHPTGAVYHRPYHRA